MSLKREYIPIGKISFYMKIAIIGSRGYPYVYSGYETFVKELANRLVKKNIEVIVYCHKGLYKEKPKKINGIELIYIPTIQSKSLSQFIHSLLSIVHFCFSDIQNLLVVNVANAPFGFLTYFLKKKTVINVDGLEWLRPKWKGLGQIYFKFCARIVKYSFGKIVTDSSEMKKIYLQNFNTDSSLIKYGAMNCKSGKSRILEKFQLKKKLFYLIIGRLVPDNNADFILKGFLKSCSNKKIVIVGDVPYRSSYSETIKKNKIDSVLFTGYVKKESELADLYKNCFAYVHGHQFGGTNPTLINAINFGCKIIALDTRFNREMLENGKFGNFFKKNNQSISNVFNSIESITDLNNESKSERKKYIEKNYNWDIITNKYIELFKGYVQ